jgi:O-acetyl-ADP-ribose deacetylase (regulator of RNase III)
VASKIPAILSVAFCSISTGVFGFPKQAAAKIAVSTVQQWARENPGRFNLIIFDVFDAGDNAIYQSVLGG